MSKIRMFIGSSANGEDAIAEMTYEYTLRKNTKRDLEIIWMRQTNDESSFWYGFNDVRWSTPFSGFRWAIPEYCNFEGRAIYTDVDMLNFRDIGELFDLSIPEDKWMLARDGYRFGGKEFCVILFDCDKFKDKIQPMSYWKKTKSYHQEFINVFQYRNLVGELDPSWNSHDGDIEPFNILHYTRMATQPWKPKWYIGETQEHPRKDLVDLFWNLSEEAKANGYKIEDYNIDRNVKYNIIGK
jgi:lipopolysaccharide biosynthesis glycosyltransferase